MIKKASLSESSLINIIKNLKHQQDIQNNLLALQNLSEYYDSFPLLIKELLKITKRNKNDNDYQFQISVLQILLHFLNMGNEYLNNISTAFFLDEQIIPTLTECMQSSNEIIRAYSLQIFISLFNAQPQIVKELAIPYESQISQAFLAFHASPKYFSDEFLLHGSVQTQINQVQSALFLESSNVSSSNNHKSSKNIYDGYFIDSDSSSTSIECETSELNDHLTMFSDPQPSQNEHLDLNPNSKIQNQAGYHPKVASKSRFFPDFFESDTINTEEVKKSGESLSSDFDQKISESDIENNNKDQDNQPSNAKTEQKMNDTVSDSSILDNSIFGIEDSKKATEEGIQEVTEEDTEEEICKEYDQNEGSHISKPEIDSVSSSFTENEILKALKEKNDFLENKLNAFQDQMIALQDKISEVQKNAQIETQTIDEEDLKNQIEILKNEKSALQYQLLQAETSQGRSSFLNCSDENTILKQQIRQITEESQAKIDNLNLVIDDLRMKLSSRSQNDSSIQIFDNDNQSRSRIEELELQIEELKEQLKEAIIESHNKNMKLKDDPSSLSNMSTSNLSTESSIRDQYEGKISELELKNQKLEEQIIEFSSSIQQNSLIQQEYENKINHYENLNKDLQEQLNLSQMDLSSKDEVIKDIQNKNEELESNKIIDQNNEKKKLKNLAQEINELHEKLDKSLKKISKLKKTRAQLLTLVQKAQKDYSSLINKTRTFKVKIENQERKNSNLVEQKKQLKQENIHLKEQLAKLQEIQTIQQNQILQYEKTITQMTVQNNSLQMENHNLQKSLEKLQQSEGANLALRQRNSELLSLLSSSKSGYYKIPQSEINTNSFSVEYGSLDIDNLSNIDLTNPKVDLATLELLEKEFL